MTPIPQRLFTERGTVTGMHNEWFPIDECCSPFKSVVNTLKIFQGCYKDQQDVEDDSSSDVVRKLVCCVVVSPFFVHQSG